MTTAQRIYSMLGNEPLWEVASHCHSLFQKSKVELIAIRKLDSSFSRYLHSSLRETFRQLVRNAQADDPDTLV